MDGGPWRSLIDGSIYGIPGNLAFDPNDGNNPGFKPLLRRILFDEDIPSTNTLSY